MKYYSVEGAKHTSDTTLAIKGASFELHRKLILDFATKKAFYSVSQSPYMTPDALDTVFYICSGTDQDRDDD